MKNYHKNPRQIKDKQFANLRAWLLELGDLSGIVHDLNTDEVISGNQRMRAIDIARCEIVLTEGPHDPDVQGTVAHGYVLWQGAKYNYRQVRWTAEQCEKANIVANKAGGSWDFDILANEWEKDDLLEWGFELEELGMLPDDDAPDDPGAQIDKAAELQAKWQTATGQLWQLGEHRLICGDCTDAAVVARVMGGEKADMIFTDPPYGMNLDTDYTKMPNDLVKSRKYSPVIGDDKPFDFASFQRLECREQFWWGADYYCQALPPGGSWFVWDKRVESNDASIGSGFELCWSKTPHKRRLLRYNWSGYTAHDPGETRNHPTQKPIALFGELLSEYSNPGAIVYDPFLGSGTTMVAAHRLGRRCFGIEIDPGYSAVCLQRMSDMGLTPVLTGDNSHA